MAKYYGVNEGIRKPPHEKEIEMKKTVCLVLAVLVLLFVGSISAYADDRGGERGGGGWHGGDRWHGGDGWGGGDRWRGGDRWYGGNRWRGSIWIGPGWGPGWWGPSYYSYYPYYPYDPYYPYYAVPPAVIQQQPQEYVQPAPQEQYYWYFCQDPQGYYPYVKKCPKGWLKVVPSAPQDEEETQ
jgi:hypothetical protein